MKRGLKITLSALLALILVAYGCWSLLRPLGSFSPMQLSLATSEVSSKLVWPVSGQAAVGVAGESVLVTHGPQTPLPTASTAKILTCLTVLGAKPLSLNEQGPLITLSANDVAIYNSYLSEQGSVVKVVAGEQISEYQALQAILLPSANNLADSLAIWAFGSLQGYDQAATTYLRDHGLSQTHLGSDASGYDPGTTSTAHDLVILGELAMENPVIAQIVAQPTASDIPEVASVKNVNSLLGTDYIVGIKTGNTDQAGGVYVSASRIMIGVKPVTIVTALVGAPDLSDALGDSLPMIQSAQDNFQLTNLTSKGEVVANYDLPWGATLPAVATANLQANVWGGQRVVPNVRLSSIKASSNGNVGELIGPDNQSVSIKLGSAFVKPSLWWRLTHPFTS